ncbi:LysR family transcriptional regulator [Bradyrhizobium sp. cf659]|uniref:LysR family transcriptional regulator n=1 Tax=Bradyrhizobium sp. cf659 TaxID=1761771 RepID=UPI0008EC6C1E|nr:LysR family transcriptional regulator [Bradyrhizobium sp. cf659]SFI05721.1 DNA-binding transcriptional regulator, LysR family [Bradyrhizobium sp. cf659]
MNLRQLEILRAVMRTRSTVAAAKDLGMSQPAVSNAIKHAESALGFLLFDRINKRMVPTQEAQILLAEAEPLFLMQDLISQTAAHLRADRKGRMRIVATSELSESLLPQVVARFSRDHGGVEISLETQRLDDLLEYVETGIVDIGFAMEPHPRPTLDYLPLAQLDMVCACPADSPLAQLSFVSPTDLRDTPLINARTSSRISSLIQEAFRRSSVNFAPAIEARFMNVAGHFVEEGLGVTIMDELTASSKRYDRLRSVPFKPKTEVTVSAIVPAGRMQQRLTQSLIRHAREEIAARIAAARQ